jgi:hypothetical protein
LESSSLMAALGTGLANRILALYTLARVERRRMERRHRLEPFLSTLGWSVIDTDELVS